MKKLLFGFIILGLVSCKGKSGSQSTPEDVVNTVFSAAKSKDYASLAKLCAPDADEDSRRICEIKEEDKPAFEEYFSKGKINGSAKISGDAAEVPIMFGPDGTKEETINLVKKDGMWYLKSF